MSTRQRAVDAITALAADPTHAGQHATAHFLGGLTALIETKGNVTPTDVIQLADRARAATRRLR
jgi:hypothetical protein